MVTFQFNVRVGRITAENVCKTPEDLNGFDKYFFAGINNSGD